MTSFEDDALCRLATAGSFATGRDSTERVSNSLDVWIAFRTVLVSMLYSKSRAGI